MHQLQAFQQISLTVQRWCRKLTTGFKIIDLNLKCHSVKNTGRSLLKKRIIMAWSGGLVNELSDTQAN